MNRAAVLFLIVLGLAMIPTPSASLPTDLPLAIFVRPHDIIQTKADIDSIVNLCAEYGVSYIFLMIKQDTGPDSGLVYYNSPRSLVKSEFDVLDETLKKAHDQNIKVYAWIPLLYDRWLAEQNMATKEYWISPLKSRQYYTIMMNEVTAYPIDGILFDYLWFPDDFAASDELKANFGQRYGYNMGSIDLSLEKERNTPLWYDWLSYRNEVLSDFLRDIMPQDLPVGVTVIPEELQDQDAEYVPPGVATFVAVQTEANPTPLINRLTLLTKAGVYVIIPDDYVSNARAQVAESTYADMLIFDSDAWQRKDFERIKKAQIPFEDIRMTRLTFIEFFNNQYNMEEWRSYEVNTAVLPAGHVFSTYFKYWPYPDKWSAYIQKYDRDYVDEMISKARNANLYGVLQVNAQSEEFATRYKDSASVTFEWGVLRKRICLTALIQDPYKTEFFEMVTYLANNYDAEAILVTQLYYLEDCFCIDCLQSYIDYMAQKGVPVEDWPRTDGSINIYDPTVREWKTSLLSQFLRDLRELIRDSNKELWVEVPVSANLELASSEYGLYLPEVEDIVDRIVLINIGLQNPPRVEYIVKSLPTPSKYILSFYVESPAPPARENLINSLIVAYNNGITSVGAYPQSSLDNSLWGGFYIAYTYRLALTDELLTEIYNMGDNAAVISTYYLLEQERAEKEMQNRETARQSIAEAKRSYSKIPLALEEAQQLNVNTTALEEEIDQALELLAEARALFIEGKYQEAEDKAKTTIIEFETLSARIQNQVEQERVRRVSSGVLILVVFLLIIMYVRFKMRRK
ncbi:MAG: hypothetical protein HXS52_07060 [Theionarchaea archaeon]|nr:hypothetical protein [Theionarchaea archaeon]MBU7037675.1 hypothetical protein [Theionarchaea archaeon]